jgi:hypothetical protein
MIFSGSCIFKTRPTHTQIPIFENSDFYQRIVTIFFEFLHFFTNFSQIFHLFYIKKEFMFYQEKSDVLSRKNEF